MCRSRSAPSRRGPAGTTPCLQPPRRQRAHREHAHREHAHRRNKTAAPLLPPSPGSMHRASRTVCTAVHTAAAPNAAHPPELPPSRRRDCHFTGTPCLSTLKQLLKVEGGAAVAWGTGRVKYVPACLCAVPRRPCLGLQINIHSVSTSDYSWSPLFEYGEFYWHDQHHHRIF